MMEETNGFATGYAVGRDSTNGGYGNGMFGNDAWWIIILLLFGYNGRGFGGFGGSYGGGGVADNYILATDFATLERKIDSVNAGICDSTFALNNTINGNFRTLDNAISTIGYQALENTNAIQSQLASGFCGVQGAIKDVAYGNERNSWTISKQISDCCCDLEKMNLQNRFDAQAYNSNTLTAIDKLCDRIIDYMSNEKVQALRDENFALRLSASQAKQNEYLISRLGDKCPEPAYIVQPPQQVTFPTNCCGQVNYAGYNSGCGYSGNF
jgi:hypothetical protein